MPLLNVDWEKRPGGALSFLHGWSATIADSLNEQIPRGERRFLAEMACRTRFKTVEEIAGFDRGPPTVYTREGDATDQKYPSFDAPVSTLIAPARFTDRVGVTVIDSSSDRWHVAAAVLFVTPDNKADSDSSLAFAVRRRVHVRRRGRRHCGRVARPAVVGHAPAQLDRRVPDHQAAPQQRRAHPRGSPDRAGRRGAVRGVAPRHRAGVPAADRAGVGSRAMHLKLDLEATYAEACTASRIP